MRQYPDENLIGKTCPFCMSTLKPENPIVICPNCHTPHHEDCWRENDKCTTFGCNYELSESEIPWEIGLQPVNGSYRGIGGTTTGNPRFQFTGNGFQMLGWGILTLMAYINIEALYVNTVWYEQLAYALGILTIYTFAIVAILKNWIIPNIKLTNGTRFTFNGIGSEILYYFFANGILYYFPRTLVKHFIKASDISSLYIYAIYIVLIPVTTLISLQIIKWFFSRINSDSGLEFGFKGSYRELLKWRAIAFLPMLTFALINILILAPFTIIKDDSVFYLIFFPPILIMCIVAPFVFVRYMKWLCLNIDCRLYNLENSGVKWKKETPVCNGGPGNLRLIYNCRLNFLGKGIELLCRPFKNWNFSPK